MQNIAVYFLIASHTLSMLVVVAKIGQDREPITPVEAGLGVAFTIAEIILLLSLIW